MGGKAFINLPMCRMDSDDYHSFAEYVESSLNDAFLKAKFSVIPSFRNKSDFGDLDILFHGDCDFWSIQRLLYAKSMFRNGDVTSYAVPITDKYFQVDLIRASEETFSFAYGYFSYNDLGNLLGRVYHRLGFKFGHTGLLYVFRDQDNPSFIIKTLVVTRCFKNALSFVGYDHHRWLQGFDELEDVFRYACSTYLANRTIFRLDETNHAARVRDRKRKTYNLFLHWVNNPENKIPEFEIATKEILRKYFLNKALILFPDFRKEYDFFDEQKVYQKIQKMKAIFNGEVVHQITELEGKELGAFIKSFFAYHEAKSGLSKSDFVFSLTPEEMRSNIRDFFHIYQQK